MPQTRVRRAVVVGLDYYGRFLADLVNEHSRDWRLTYYSSSRMDTVRESIAAARADAIICFSGPGPNVALVEIARARHIPIIVIWAGSDVLTSQKEPHLLELIKRYGFTNITDGPWLVEELRALGIDAPYVPVTAVENPDRIAPLPQTFSVLTYLPEPRRAFYGERMVYSIARRFPEIRFRVVGKGGRNAAAPPNVEFLGYVHDMPTHIDASTVLLRLPEHDGKSMLVLETLARGRHVIWNYDFPGVHHAPRENDAIRILARLKELHDAGRLETNDCAQQQIVRDFGRERLARSFEHVLNTAPPAQPRARSGERRVAMSGLSLFVAQVAGNVQNGGNGWIPQILRTSARLEVLTSLFTIVGCDVWYSIGAPISDRWLHLFARLLRKPRVIHWVGSDITSVHANARLRWLCTRPNVRVLAEVDWTLKELADLGIPARLAPLPPRLPAIAQPAPLPERFTILFYVPGTRADFYGRAEYERLIRAYSKRGVRFFVVGGGQLYAPPEADVTQFGWRVSLDEVYRETSLLIRLTKHDGLSLMVLEALTHGRHVLWSQDFPYVTQVTEYQSMAAQVEHLLAVHERGELEVQREAACYIAKTYDRERCMARIVETWNDAAERQKPPVLAMEAQQ